MKILSIAVKEIKQIFRMKNVVFMMVAFPLLLILILGTALEGDGSGKTTVINTKALYLVEKEGIVSEAFKSFNQEFSEELIKFTQVETKEEGIDILQEGDHSALVIINGEDNQIQVIKSPKFDFEGDFVEGIINSFADRASVAMTLYKYDRNSIDEVKENEGYSEYVTIEGINTNKKEPRAIDYYGITMLTMIIMYFTTTASEFLLYEKVIGTDKRIKISNITGIELFFGKLFGQIAASAIQIGIIMGVSSLVYKVNYGQDIKSVILIVSSQAVLMIAIGLLIGTFSKPDAPAGTIFNIAIPILVFLGGGYFPIYNLGSKFLISLGKLSPVKWINQSLFEVIYSGSYSVLNKLLLINTLVTFIILLVVAIGFRRKECTA
ncbi:ABC transporter permease [Oceanirhabdus sp. W0125-5]|uniref:ABC transporter permease n=1 Tax=Oceanirhabdus sp. W0125-5 TaxID=2999116 RepID=UPI0022F33B9F|nr:ABC transporter permease [Oceanirhabdus sp. W0125-5]WBW98932.1 ABC transporter permease [Oceanirhabdus sp. W0125-5]